MNKTKIVCTVKNYKDGGELLKKLINKGMSATRINFSHSTQEDAKKLIDNIKELRNELSVPLSIIIDTKGPEKRIFGYDDIISINKGDQFTICSKEVNEKKGDFITNLPSIDKIVETDEIMLIMDGYFKCKVIDRKEGLIKVSFLNEGKLRPNAHLTIQNTNTDLPFLSEKDISDIKFAVDEKADYIALSFVRKAEDINDVRKIMRERNKDTEVKLISKVENWNAVHNMDEIIDLSDGIMVARGDLGVEIDIEKVPIVQKDLIKRCLKKGKPVITATQMLETMIDHPLPTRAEVSDVANACFDLTSSVMLSGETAIGKYPLLTVETMKKILIETEQYIDYEDYLYKHRASLESKDQTDVISYAAVTTAYRSGAKAIIAMTESGYTARMISRFRPGLPIFAFTTSMKVYNQLAVSWGVEPNFLEEEEDSEVLFEKVMEICKEKKYIKKEDIIVLVAGLPLGIKGKTNIIRVEVIK